MTLTCFSHLFSLALEGSSDGRLDAVAYVPYNEDAWGRVVLTPSVTPCNVCIHRVVHDASATEYEMRRWNVLVAAALLVAAAASCTPEGVGDPCEPESCPPDEVNPEVCDWQYEEVYLEHFSLQCRTRVCLVFRPEPNVFDPYCSRRCGPGAAYTKCPAKFACAEVASGATAGAGCYCVDKEQLNLDPFSGSNDLDKLEACK